MMPKIDDSVVYLYSCDKLFIALSKCVKLCLVNSHLTMNLFFTVHPISWDKLEVHFLKQLLGGLLQFGPIGCISNGFKGRYKSRFCAGSR